MQFDGRWLSAKCCRRDTSHLVAKPGATWRSSTETVLLPRSNSAASARRASPPPAWAGPGAQIGEFHRLGQTAEQHQTQAVLQQAYRTAHGAGGDAQLPRRGQKAAVAGRNLEGTQGIEGRQAADHGRGSVFLGLGGTN